MTDNIYVRPATENNRLKVATNEIGSQDSAIHYPVYDTFPVQVARGLVSGAQPIGSYGERTTAGAETNRIIWPNGVFTLPDAAGVQMSIVSTSANDAAAGTGIQTIEIHYLDEDLIEKTEIVTLNGLTPVLTTATNIRFINCMHIQTYGANAYAAGDITASNGGTTYSQISTNETRCTSSARMIPAGKRAFLAGASAGSVSGTAATSAVVRIVATELDNHQYIDPLIFIPFGSVGIQDTSESFNFPVPLPFSAGSVIAMSATVDKAATVTGSWFGWLEDV